MKAIARRRGMRRMHKGKGTGRGVTLVELLTAIAVVAALAGVAAPAFRSLLLNQRLASSSQAFVAALNMARIEAIRQAGPVVVAMGGPGGWGGGWSVIAEDDAGGSASKVLRRFEKLPTGIEVDDSLGDGFAQGLRYDSQGFSRGARHGGFGAGCLTFKARTGRRASIVVSASGRAKACDPDRAGDCGTGVCGRGGRP